MWRFPRYGSETTMGARLVVRESQVAVFVNGGRLANVYQRTLQGVAVTCRRSAVPTG